MRPMALDFPTPALMTSTEPTMTTAGSLKPEMLLQGERPRTPSRSEGQVAPRGPHEHRHHSPDEAKANAWSVVTFDLGNREAIWCYLQISGNHPGRLSITHILAGCALQSARCCCVAGIDRDSLSGTESQGSGADGRGLGRMVRSGDCRLQPR